MNTEQPLLSATNALHSRLRAAKLRPGMFYKTFDNFYEGAQELRREFEKNFAPPSKSAARSGTLNPKRFVWDNWYVEDQYILARTPAWEYFSRTVYARFHRALLKFGREILGCYDVTPPWLSSYTDGCLQELHADVPHGPWAFVFSLSPWWPEEGPQTRKEKSGSSKLYRERRAFTGGETWILNPSTLQYWQNFSSFKGVELNELTTRIPAYFNRLTIFDPRLPHGVREVRGTRDPLKGRLVIHGWFKDPEPYVVGTLSRRDATLGCNEILSRIEPLFDEYVDCHGTLSVRFKVSHDGRVSEAKLLTSTLQSLIGSPDAGYERVRALCDSILRAVRLQKFRSARGTSFVTLPLLFRF